MAAGSRRLSAPPAAAAPLRVAVATSGGLDSTALLHATLRWADAHGAEVHALHVHHGLYAEADDWLAQVQAQCRRWQRPGRVLRFHAVRVSERPGRGDSVEAWARGQRYQALAAMARGAGCELVLLAHHRRDQAETVVLQALRGAGAAGLAAMPACVRRDGLTWARPWLAQPRAAIEAYARRWRLAHVQDPSNTDDRHARSRLRQRVWPALLRAFPDAEDALCRVARHAAEARVLAEALARIDAAAVVDGDSLRVAAWALLAPERQANLLRHWLRAHPGVVVPETLVQRLCAELPQAVAAQWPCEPGGLELHRGRLRHVPPAGAAQPSPSSPASALRLDLATPGRHAVPAWAGAFTVQAAPQGLPGVPALLLQQAELRPRRGGEQFQSHEKGVPRSLKKQYQAAGVPASARHGPLVWALGQLVYVPGLGLDARAVARAGEPRLAVHWSA